VKVRALALAMLFAVAPAAPAQVVQLITDDEAKLPAATALTSRGVTRGPGIKVLSPDTAGKLGVPFELKVAFTAHGGAKIDPATIKVTYLKSPLVDLTPRLAAGISAEGITIAKAGVPSGEHKIRIAVKDSDGRQNSEVLTLNVGK
jgi:hypothetical protein